MSGFRFTPLALTLIREHAAKRSNAATIAAIMNCSQSTVERICQIHGVELVEIENGAPPLAPTYNRARDGSRPNYRTVELTIPVEVVERFQREAMRRGCTYTRLIERVCEVVATDLLFPAVLDQ